MISAKSFIDMPFSTPTLNKWCPSGIFIDFIRDLAPSSTYSHSRIGFPVPQISTVFKLLIFASQIFFIIAPNACDLSA